MTLRELVAKVIGVRVGDIEVGYNDSKLDYQVVVDVNPEYKELSFNEIKKTYVNSGSKEIEVTI